MYKIQTHRYWTLSQLHALRAQVMAYSQTQNGRFPSDTYSKIHQQNLQAWRIKNPSVVLYVGDTCLGIFSYRITLKYIEECKANRGAIFYHPVNFKSRDEYREFLKEGVISENAFRL